MKLIFAIVQNDDSRNVINDLNKNGFRVTKLSSTGGFLKTGNVTLLVGVDESKVDTVIKIIKRNSQSRKQALSTPTLSSDHILPNETDFNCTSDQLSGIGGLYSSCMDEVIVGGATIFVTSVERYE